MSFSSFLPSRIACPLETWTRGVCCRAYKTHFPTHVLVLYFLPSSPLIFKCTIKVVDESCFLFFLKIMDIPEYGFVSAPLSLSKSNVSVRRWLKIFVEIKRRIPHTDGYVLPLILSTSIPKTGAVERHKSRVLVLLEKPNRPGNDFVAAPLSLSRSNIPVRQWLETFGELKTSVPPMYGCVPPALSVLPLARFFEKTTKSGY
jgi:hypothetical protein